MSRVTLLCGNRSYFLTEDIVLVGRSLNNDLVLDDVLVSRRHALLCRDGDTYTIIDFKSTNGVFVNDRRVLMQKLKDRDRIKVGGLIFEVLVSGGPDVLPAQNEPESFKVFALPCAEMLTGLLSGSPVRSPLQVTRSRYGPGFADLLALCRRIEEIDRLCDIPSVTERALEIARKATSSHRAFIALVQDAVLCITASKNAPFVYEDDLRVHRFPAFFRSFAYDTWIHTRPQRFSLSSSSAVDIDKGDIGHMLAVPLADHAPAPGVLCLGRIFHSEPYDEGSLALMSRLAGRLNSELTFLREFESSLFSGPRSGHPLDEPCYRPLHSAHKLGETTVIVFRLRPGIDCLDPEGPAESTLSALFESISGFACFAAKVSPLEIAAFFPALSAIEDSDSFKDAFTAFSAVELAARKLPDGLPYGTGFHRAASDEDLFTALDLARLVAACAAPSEIWACENCLLPGKQPTPSGPLAEKEVHAHGVKIRLARLARPDTDPVVPVEGGSTYE